MRLQLASLKLPRPKGSWSHGVQMGPLKGALNATAAGENPANSHVPKSLNDGSIAYTGSCSVCVNNRLTM